MSRSAYFDKEARDALVEGANLVADAVKTTLGAAGRTVVIQEKDKSPIITKDGVTVAKQISPKDEKVKLGADLAISVAQKQLDTVGDGTTSATVLAQAIINQGARQLELSNGKINRTSFRRGIEKGANYVIKKLEEYSTEITTDAQLNNIAIVSANGDEALGNTVAEAYRKVGKNGVVLVEETKDREIHLDFKEGMTFDKGWTSQFFVNNQEDQTVEFDNPRILLSNSKISNFQMLAEACKDVLGRGEPVVIIAESFDASVTQGLAMNIIRSGGQLKVACVEAPSFGDNRLNRLRDMSIYLGAQVVDDPMSGIKLETMTALDFGSCDKIIIKRDETIIRGGHGNPEDVQKRIEALNGELGVIKENDTMTKELLEKRIAALTTGVAVIQVGGSSEEQIKETKDRLEDAQFSVKAALEEGYLPGGGTVLLHLADKTVAETEVNNDDERVGLQVFAKALSSPFETLLDNAGVHADIIAPEVLSKDYTYGYNVKTLKVVNMVEDGIIDPTKAVKGVVYAASSIASVALTSDVIICEDPIENNGVSLNMVPQPMM